jgi:hypothetical protein
MEVVGLERDLALDATRIWPRHRGRTLLTTQSLGGWGIAGVERGDLDGRTQSSSEETGNDTFLMSGTPGQPWFKLKQTLHSTKSVYISDEGLPQLISDHVMLERNGKQIKSGEMRRNWRGKDSALDCLTTFTDLCPNPTPGGIRTNLGTCLTRTANQGRTILELLQVLLGQDVLFTALDEQAIGTCRSPTKLQTAHPTKHARWDDAKYLRRHSTRPSWSPPPWPPYLASLAGQDGATD